ncbi:TRAP transporter small permease [Azoarcus taiwanensis]|uniref:TRAP transporter small permease protein n=1 Tax=Azoarcus taiwanensis TaxID=666964 RepID=A0A972F9Q9_9RHOO|nr:TRAP transporter small permease [Azoarcus taiwanensis]NMG04460.1 TRAP transporter small permease subunit [Azoarcus taiwanensis]
MNSSKSVIRAGIAPGLEAAVGRVVGWCASALAIVGGAVLTALAIMSVISITGRWAVGTSIPLLSSMGPVQGDFELVEMGAAFAVFSFLGWCQYQRGHVTVDIFVSRLSPRALAGLSTLSNAAITAVAVLIAWQHGLGMMDRMRYNESTMILQVPIWWSYAASLVGAWMFALVSLYTVWRSANEMLGQGESAHATGH